MPAKAHFMGANADAIRRRTQQRIVGQLPADNQQLDSETSSTRASSDAEMGEENITTLPPPPPPLLCDCGCDDIAANRADESESAALPPESGCDCGCGVPRDDTIETSAFPPEFSMLHKTFLALKLEVAQGYKDMGAQLFKQGQFDEALDKYKAVQCVLLTSRVLPEELNPSAEDLKRASWLNSAACFLKLGEHKLTSRCCNQVLRKEPFNEKALFRSASALIGLEMYSEALSDLHLLLEKHPNNSEARRLLPQVERFVHQVQRKAQRKEKSVYLKMFGDLGSDTAAVISSDRAEIPESPAVV
jgi:hypothetical protein